MTSLLHAFELTGAHMRVQLRARLQFRASFVIELLTTALWMLVYVGFWSVIFSQISTFQGWTFASVVLFVAFQELFHGLSQGLFRGALLYYHFIHTGRLETSLTRPIDARLSAIALNVEPYQLIRSAVMFGLFTVFAVQLGAAFSLPHLLLGILTVLLAAVGKALFGLCVNYIAFWWSNVDALHEVLGTFDHFLRVPLNVLPSTLQLFFTFGLPYMFAATFPALLMGGEFPLRGILMALFGLAAALGGLFVLQEVLWRVGLRRYDGRGG
ncbi:ABC-2 family transporter protein [Deinococcus sp. SM5_A1]|uniref:ABC-2 family transporter protein n=1 Tax=Deinococcus sp. SM5_A1 TaxID=3379094 RepID=UPI00385F35C2